MELMMKSVGYMIEGIPSEALRFITAIGMPLDDYDMFPADSPTCSLSSWSYAEPLLRHLTSVHLLGLAGGNSDLSPVLLKCTALKQLHYYGSSMRHLEPYLSTQPRLDAFGVSFHDYSEDEYSSWVDLELSAIRAIDKLEHRPKLVSLSGWRYEMNEMTCPGWARDISCVVLQHFGSPYDRADPSTFLEVFSKNLGVPCDNCWGLKVKERDPFDPYNITLPLAAYISSRQKLFPDLESRLSIRQTN
jgi:hypothetical protein